MNQSLKHGLKLKKLHIVIIFNQKVWLTLYIDINTRLKIKVKFDFEKDFFKLMKNTVFGKTMENVRKKKTCDN